MNGLDLPEMDAADMLDVLHFMFEADYTPPSEESAKSRSAIRESIYPSLYNMEYRYALPKSNEKLPGDGRFGVPDDLDLDVEDEPLPEPFSPRKREVKPFTPATELRQDEKLPFGTALDAPLK